MKALGIGYSELLVIKTQGERVVGFIPLKNEFVVATFNQVQHSYLWSHYFVDVVEAYSYCKEHELMELAEALKVKYIHMFESRKDGQDEV